MSSPNFECTQTIYKIEKHFQANTVFASLTTDHYTIGSVTLARRLIIYFVRRKMAIVFRTMIIVIEDENVENTRRTCV